MLGENRLKASLRAGARVFGLLSSVPSPLLVEMLGYAGYDFVILDMEHVCLNPETLENMVRAAECSGLTPLVRVPGVAPDAILRALDCGAQGVVVPHVRSAGDAQAVVRASRYHPLGMRGISGGRTTGFGTLSLPEYFARANAEVMVVLMIEDEEGVEAIDEIVQVPGVDLVLEGAMDLSQSLGVPTQVQHPQVQGALERIAQSCLEHSVAFCAVPRQPGELQRMSDLGANAFLLGDDRGVAFRALKAHAQVAKGQVTDRQRAIDPTVRTKYIENHSY